MNVSLVRPEPRRVVPKPVVESLIAHADREISELEREAAIAVAAAQDAEARLAMLGVDERSAAWATVQLERFVARLRAEVEAEAAAVIDEATVSARLMVEEARAEADAARAQRVMFGAAEPAPVATDASREREERVTAEIGPAPEPEAAESAPTTPRTDDVDPIFRAISPESLAVAEPVVANADDAGFWPAEPERRRRLPRPSRRVVATQGLALLLVAAAAVVRFV
jgi:hypothetical protein